MSAFEQKLVRLREELNALTECIVAVHTRNQDEADLDTEILHVRSWIDGVTAAHQLIEA